MEKPELERLLLYHQRRLLRRCRKAAWGRPGLSASDLAQQAVVAFLEKQESWFAQPVRSSIEGQAWELLRNSVRHATTAHDHHRQRGKHLGEPAVLEQIPDRFDLAGAEALSQEEALLAQENATLLRAAVDRALGTMKNPVYRLVLKALDVHRLLRRDDFQAADAHRAGGSRAFVRPWSDAATLVLEALGREVHQAAARWRRFVALAVRTELDPDSPVESTEVRTATGWLDRNHARAQQALKVALWPS
jgi:hypothetical protein